MTKLMQWLFGLAIFLSVWLSLIWEYCPSGDDTIKLHIWLVPIYMLAVFGLFCLMLLIYRVYTFNDCEKAAAELRKEIEDAKSDLSKKGFEFNH